MLNASRNHPTPGQHPWSTPIVPHQPVPCFCHLPQVPTHSEANCQRHFMPPILLHLQPPLNNISFVLKEKILRLSKLLSSKRSWRLVTPTDLWINDGQHKQKQLKASKCQQGGKGQRISPTNRRNKCSISSISFLLIANGTYHRKHSFPFKSWPPLEKPLTVTDYSWAAARITNYSTKTLLNSLKVSE